MSNFLINSYPFVVATQEYCQSVSTTSQGFNDGRDGIGTHLGSGHVLAGTTITKVIVKLNYLGFSSTPFQIKFYNASAGEIGTFASGNTSSLTGTLTNYSFTGSEDMPSDGGYIGVFIDGSADDKMAVAYSGSTNEDDAVLAYFGSTYSDTWEDQATTDSLTYCADYS